MPKISLEIGDFSFLLSYKKVECQIFAKTKYIWNLQKPRLGNHILI